MAKIIKEIIITKETFNTSLTTFEKNEGKRDMTLQRLAEFSANQSILHNNADYGIRFINKLQELKTGAVAPMVKYLCVIGNFGKNEDTGKFGYMLKKDIKEVLPQTEAVWKKHAKVEKIEVPKNDAWVQNEVQRIIGAAKKWATTHGDNKVSDKVLNTLTDILPKPVVQVEQQLITM